MCCIKATLLKYNKIPVDKSCGPDTMDSCSVDKELNDNRKRNQVL